MSTVLFKHITFTLLLTVIAVILPTGALAQLDTGFDDAERAANEGKISTSTDPLGLITSAVKTLLGFVGIIAVVIIIYGGVLYITSAGDDTKAEKAKKLILYAVVGLLLIGAAALIVNVVISFFGSGGSE